MAVSPVRRWLGISALVVVLGGALWYFRPLLFPAKVDEIARAGEVPELPPIKVAPGDWPWWRGPTSDGHAPDAGAPTSWEEHDILWKRAIPGRGHSTPILIGNRVILTTADESAGKQIVLALERSTGEPLWETTVHEGGLMSKHAANSHASGTPACDGERIFVQFLNAGAQRLTALNLQGQILWQTEVGPHQGRGSHGCGPSPALWGSFAIVAGDAPEAGFLAAVHRQTGQVVWRKARRSRMGSYGSPLVAEINGKPQVLLSGNERVCSYDPATGDLLWSCEGLSHVSANTPVLAGDVIVGSSGAGRKMIGAVLGGEKRWELGHSSEIPYATTPVHDDGFLYYISEEALAICLEAKTGEVRWKERLEGIGPFWASPMLSGKEVYAARANGDVLVFKADPERLQLTAINRMESGVYASPIAVGGKLFIRTEAMLYCIGK